MIPHRKPNRLPNYNYSKPWWYFVTICTKDKTKWFGEIDKGEMKLNKYGKIVKQCWLDLPNHYHNCEFDTWIIMPNHFHGIVIINNISTVPVGTGLKPVPTIRTQHSLSEIIRGFKTFSSRRINETKPQIEFRWQRSFYDHIIRNEISCNKIREYIQNNPMRWEFDKNSEDQIEL